MATIELLVTVEVPDETVEFLENLPGGALGAAATLVQSALSAQKGFGTVIVTDGAGVESPHSHAVARPERSPSTGTGKPAQSVSVARTAVQKPADNSGQATGRMGRPATLHDYEASDGQPVREWGQRSPEELRARGIKVWKVGQRKQPAESTPTAQSKPAAGKSVKVPGVRPGNLRSR
jgi:hypothetical protein